MLLDWPPKLQTRRFCQSLLAIAVFGTGPLLHDSVGQHPRHAFRTPETFWGRNLRPSPRSGSFLTARRLLMSAEKRNQFRDMLLALRDRARGEVNHVVQALQEEVNVNANTSAAP